MDREVLYRNLNELEIQLKGIKSATEQVNAVIAADKELAKSFREYALSLIEQISSLQAWYQRSLTEIQAGAGDAIKSANQTLHDFDEACRAVLNDTSATMKADHKEELEKVQNILSEATDKMKTDMQGMTDKISKEMSESLSSLSNLATNTLPTLATRLNDTINNELEPLVKVEMAKTLSDALAEYKSAFTKCENSLKEIKNDMSSKMSRIVVDVENACAALSGLPAKIKEEIDNFKSTFEVSLLNQQQLLANMNTNIEQIKSDISKDLKVSEQAAQDTVAAMKKLDKVADEFNKAIRIMTQKNDLLADQVAKNEQKLTDLQKSNKLLVILLVLSMLVIVIATIGPRLL